MVEKSGHSGGGNSARSIMREIIFTVLWNSVPKI